MKVGIVGAGSMGSLFGGLLAAGGEDVLMLDVVQEHVDAINRDGLRMTFEGQERVVPVAATTDPADAEVVDVLMLWCKSPANEAALSSAAGMIGPETIGCTLQNGLGNVRDMARHFPLDRLVNGVTETGAKMMGPGHIELTPGAWNSIGSTLIGGQNEAGMAAAEQVKAMLDGAGVPTEVRADVDAVIWGKLVVACPMAPIASVTRLEIGNVVGEEHVRPLLAALAEEVVDVAAANGVDLDREAAVKHAFEVWEGIGSHHPSMLQDVLAHRPTEIASLCGAVAREGERAGVPTPLNALMASLVTLVQDHYDEQLGVV